VLLFVLPVYAIIIIVYNNVGLHDEDVSTHLMNSVNSCKTDWWWVGFLFHTNKISF